MKKSMRPEFVEFVPELVQDGILYISIPYSTATHNCPCGCGERVVTPIKPTDWTLTWNGEAVSLNPSIGNWSVPCQSHYWIVENRIVWAKKWTAARIAAGQEMDRQAKARYYGKSH